MGLQTRVAGLTFLLAGCQPTATVSVAALARDLEAGRVTARDALIDPRWDPVRATGPFRRLMRDHAASSAVTLVQPDEPGTPLVVTGRFTDTSGKPIAGVGIYVYHTDAAGYYTPGVLPGGDDRSPRLYGFLRTDADGRYAIRTIVPGGYAGATDATPHAHFSIHAPGYERTRGVGPPSLYLCDRASLPPAWVDEMIGDGGKIVPASPDADGVVRCEYDWVLRANQTGRESSRLRRP